MGFSDIVESITAGDWWADTTGRVGKVSTIASLTGLATTQNLAWVGGMAFGLATLIVQIWWEWQRQQRRAKLEDAYDRKRAWQLNEIEKARLAAKLKSEGIDTATLRALQQSPDPDSEVTP